MSDCYDFPALGLDQFEYLTVTKQEWAKLLPVVSVEDILILAQIEVMWANKLNQFNALVREHGRPGLFHFAHWTMSSKDVEVLKRNVSKTTWGKYLQTVCSHGNIFHVENYEILMLIKREMRTGQVYGLLEPVS